MSAGRLAPLQAWWLALTRRERTLVAIGAAAVALLLVVSVAVLPAWRAVRAAPAQIDALDAQLQAMRSLAGEAGALRATPPVNAGQSLLALKAASDRLGERGRLNVQGDRAVLTLTGAGTEELRNWLAEVRSGARARPLEATLSRGVNGYSGSIVVAVGGGA